MKLAIEEAKRSSFEDDRVHLKVGAVVTLEGKILSKARIRTLSGIFIDRQINPADI